MKSYAIDLVQNSQRKFSQKELFQTFVSLNLRYVVGYKVLNKRFSCFLYLNDTNIVKFSVLIWCCVGNRITHMVQLPCRYPKTHLILKKIVL